MKYKIAIGGIHIESSTFTPYTSGAEDFIVLRDEELLQKYQFLQKYDDVEIIPLIHARAMPGGQVEKCFFLKWYVEFFDYIEDLILDEQLDAVILDVHGAMVVEDMTDAEGNIASKLRALVGENCIITCTMDLHGNISDKLFAACDLITCYRTAPHTDVIATKERALQTTIRALKNKDKKIYKAKVDIPIMLSGEMTSTQVSPGRELYASIDDICLNEGIIDASIWMGFPWADEERCHGSIVVTGFSRESVKDAARTLARNYWQNRENFEFVGPVASLQKAVHLALSSNEKPFFISDTGDNPGAGGSGDNTVVLREFHNIEQNGGLTKKVLIASICDAQTINEVYAYKEGDTITIELGAKIDYIHSTPIVLDVTIKKHFKNAIGSRCATVTTGNIDIIITEARWQYGRKTCFAEAGVLWFAEYDIIVVKMGYLEPDLSKEAEGWVMALTSGSVPQDLSTLDYKHRLKPLFPFESREAFGNKNDEELILTWLTLV